MSEETFKITLNFPISALKAFELLVNTTVEALWKEETFIRAGLQNPDLPLEDAKAISGYLENTVIPQQMIASELQRAFSAANPKIVI